MALAWRERNGHGGRQSAVGTALVEHLAHGADVNGVVLEDFDESVFEGVGSYPAQQGPPLRHCRIALPPATHAVVASGMGPRTTLAPENTVRLTPAPPLGSSGSVIS
jgi:hypothetical protein